MTAERPARYDQIVIGAGTAGCVVAAGLVRRGASVLLLEAGADQPTDPEHPMRRSATLVLEGHNWPHRVNLRTSERRDQLARGVDPTDPPARAAWAHFPYAVGRVVGGSSAVNGTIAQRGLPRDFAAWADHGLPAWSWEQVRPAYERVEERIGLTRASAFHPLDRALLEACRARGIPVVDDLNGEHEAAAGAMPSNSADGRRHDLASTHLAPLRDAETLTVRTGAHVHRIRTNGTTATGVEWDEGDTLQRADADAVTVCAGALATPALLQRSGIGDPTLLGALGIDVVQALPGVGENLADHAAVVIWALPKPGVVTHRPLWRELAVRLPGGVDAEPDVQIGLLNNVDGTAIPSLAGRLGDDGLAVGMSIMLMRPESRGRVFLRTPEPERLPIIELGLGSEPVDVARLTAGVRTAHELLTGPGLGDHLTDVHFWNAGLLARPEAAASGVRNLMAPGWHACGTAAMGSADDPGAVVDEQGRVHGMTALRVVDASIFPTIPSMPTNLTTAMVADRIVQEFM